MNLYSRYLDPKNDLSFKKIFGSEKHKEIPIHFLNAVFELKEENQIIDLEFLETRQPPEIEARKESIVDVLVRDQKGIKYVVEMQVSKKEPNTTRQRPTALTLDVGENIEILNKSFFWRLLTTSFFQRKRIGINRIM